jgi:hypothetical protein
MELSIKDLKEYLLNDTKSLNNKSNYSFICKNSFMILPNKNIVRSKNIFLILKLCIS